MPTRKALDPTAAARRKAKLERRQEKRSRLRQQWEGAETTLHALRNQLTDHTDLSAFDQAIEHRVQLLKTTDEQNGKRLVAKARSRLFRAIEIVKDLPQFCGSLSLEAADNALSSLNVTATEPTSGIIPASPILEPFRSSAVSTKPNIMSTDRLQYERLDQLESANAQKVAQYSFFGLDTYGPLPSGLPPVMLKQEVMLEDHAAPGHLRELRQAQDLVWTRHQANMQRYFAAKSLPKLVWTTKMAIQEKGFRTQAENELQVADAKAITEQQAGNGTQVCITDFGGTFFDTEFAKDALWELSSTQLWQYYEGGHSWDQLGWIPGGYLRIQETRAAGKNYPPEASVILEFGNRAFTAECVPIPRCE